MLSAYEKQVWRDLGAALGGFGRIAEITDRRLIVVTYWRYGYGRPSIGAIDRLIDAVAGLPAGESGRVGLAFELRRWRDDSVARKAAATAKVRQAFLQRFGHLPDDPAWQRRGKTRKDAVTPAPPGRSGIPRSRDRRDF